MYDIYLGVDSSGSMQGSNAERAFEATCILKRVSEKLGFNIRIWKRDTESQEITDKVDKAREANGGGTYDECLFREIAKVIRPENQSIVYVITDGQTAKSEGRQTLIDKISKTGIIYGIGIGEVDGDLIKENYPNGVKVELS